MKLDLTIMLKTDSAASFPILHLELCSTRGSCPAGCPTHSIGWNEWEIALSTSRNHRHYVMYVFSLLNVTAGLKGYYLEGSLHFITFSCYRRQQHLATASRRDLFLRVLEHARRRYGFAVLGYVVMPEHIHLLMTMPGIGDPSVVMKVVKERFTRLLRKHEGFTGPMWQKRFYDFNVCTDKKRVEKLRYMHRNPVKRGLVNSPEDWDWSSFPTYWHGEKGLVEVDPSPWKFTVGESHSFQPME